MMEAWRRCCHNLDKGNYEGESQYDIPTVDPIYINKEEVPEFVTVNQANTCKDPENKVLHFCNYDFVFEKYWTHPDRYLDQLRRFKFVAMPDFSMYADYPAAVNIYNCYRNHWLARYWQDNGIDVIYTPGWVEEESFEWCFAGAPRGGTVFISSLGTQKKQETKTRFSKGYEEMLRRVRPDTVIFHGVLPEEYRAENVVQIKHYAEQQRDALSEVRKDG